mmetsp:Transcript_44651/g.123755  ORF Transcript_44651/g.123755 Transcript_44651/m.123755 type:complete len:588 (-) Transcript_44651:35-1798(-)
MLRALLVLVMHQSSARLLFGPADAHCVLHKTCSQARFQALVSSLSGGRGLSDEAVMATAEQEREWRCGSVWDRFPCFLSHGVVSSRYELDGEPIHEVGRMVHSLLASASDFYVKFQASEMRLHVANTARRLDTWWLKVLSWPWAHLVSNACPIFIAFDEVFQRQCKLSGCKVLGRSWGKQQLQQGQWKWLWRHLGTVVPIPVSAFAHNASMGVTPFIGAALLLGLAKVFSNEVSLARAAGHAHAAALGHSLVLRLVQLSQGRLQETQHSMEGDVQDTVRTPGERWSLVRMLRLIGLDLMSSPLPGRPYNRSSRKPCDIVSAQSHENRERNEVEFFSYHQDWLRARLRSSPYSRCVASTLGMMLPGRRPLPAHRAEATRVLDLGCGPGSVLDPELVIKGVSVDLVAADAAADGYNTLLNGWGITPRVRVQRAEAETVGDAFPSESFDVVLMTNSLDHAYHPVQGLEAIVRVLRPGGSIFLMHSQNVGVRTKYNGLHQWNFDVHAGRFLVWRPGESYDAGTVLGSGVSLSAHLMSAHSDWRYVRLEGATRMVCVVLRKHDPQARDSSDNVAQLGKHACESFQECERRHG